MKALTHQSVVLVFWQDEPVGIELCERHWRSESEVDDVVSIAIDQQPEHRTG